MPQIIFRRPALAHSVASVATGAGRITGLPPGLFLAAPRRTGKSTFLELDLVPELESRGYLVLYIDLWKNKDEAPAKLISQLVATSLAEHQGFIARTAASVGLTKVRIQGVEFSLDQVGKHAGASLTEALHELREASGKPIALIVDEAQHVVKVDEQMSVMFALKAARDSLNRSSLNLVLVMSGSDRDKLVRLVVGNAAPFLGATIEDLPRLGRDYTDFVAGQLAASRPDLAIDNERLLSVFERFEFRPEPFGEAITSLTGALTPRDIDFHAELDTLADDYVSRRDAEFSDAYRGMTPVQRAVFTWLLDSSPGPRMFSREALAFYSTLVGEEVSTGAAQEALRKLRENDPPIVWKSMRGDYALEETGMLDWYQRRKRDGSWPPR